MSEAPPIIPPPELSLPQVASSSPNPADRFLICQSHGAQQGANLWYEPSAAAQGGSPHARDLIISFDNLATIDEGWPRAPWAHHRLAPIGAAILGVQSHSKNWFRSPAAPELLRALASAEFFSAFDRIVMTGASMGGFAAINFAPLVPRARVLAFSAQSTMNKHIAPFEARFPFAVRKSNWEDAAFLDAASAIAHIPAVTLLFDPQTPEDAQHAARMRAPHVQHLRAPHATHEAVRVVMKSGAFAVLVQDMLTHGRATPAFWAAYRARKSVPKWQKSMLSEALGRGHNRLALNAAAQVLAMGAQAGIADEDLAFARGTQRRAQAQLATLAMAT
jgi:hypothetical protein